MPDPGKEGCPAEKVGGGARGELEVSISICIYTNFHVPCSEVHYTRKKSIRN